ncbi:hypothetical protein BRD17_02410 [Halobacteriales archaeon SW_7_68_16]|nr:MAG: hypothetical protein BRD17_02410 [Halobacteriales archaeon SW_7_68_16]
MGDVKLNELDDALADLTYPVMRTDAATEFEGVTLRLADGEVDLGRAISDTASDSFTSVGELTEEIRRNLPVEATGEPGQSEGDG